MAESRERAVRRVRGGGASTARAGRGTPERGPRRASPKGARRAAELASVPPPPAARLLHWVDRMRGVPALVWGDFVLDEYWRCLTRRVSREAPVLVLDWQSRAAQGGGAANAALNLAALGATVRALGWIGADEAGAELRGLLERAGVEASGLLPHPCASSVVKIRIVAGSVHTALQQVVRVDRGAAFRSDPDTDGALARALARAARGVRAVVLSDYGYDSVTPEHTRGAIRQWRARGVTVALDARYRLAAYRGVTLATPNESEAAAAAGLEAGDERGLARIAARLMRVVRPRHLIVTRGRDGLTLWGGSRGLSLAAHGGEEAVDVTGAGDAVVATATLALAAGAPALEAAALANVAGSVAVSRRGAVAVGSDDLRRALGGGPGAKPGARSGAALGRSGSRGAEKPAAKGARAGGRAPARKGAGGAPPQPRRRRGSAW